MPIRSTYHLLALHLVLGALFIVSPAWSATISAGYNLGGPTINCNLVQGNSTGAQTSLAITESDCDTSSGFSGSFTLTGSAAASYGVVRAAAAVEYTNLSRPNSTYAFGQAIGQSAFSDSITLDVAGRTGEVVDLVFAFALSGSASATISGGGSSFVGSSSGVLNFIVNGQRARASATGNASGPGTTENTGPGTVSITLGTPFNVSASLISTARLDSFGSPGLSLANGLATAAFGNSGGITSFKLIDANALEINGFTMSSESGQFAFYAVPEPSTALLVGLGIALFTVSRQQR